MTMIHPKRTGTALAPALALATPPCAQTVPPPPVASPKPVVEMLTTCERRSVPGMRTFISGGFRSRDDQGFGNSSRCAVSAQDWIARNQRSTMNVDLGGPTSRVGAVQGAPLMGLTTAVGVLVVDRGAVDGVPAVPPSATPTPAPQADVRTAAVGDGNAAIAESNEGNNTGLRNVAVGA